MANRDKWLNIANKLGAKLGALVYQDDFWSACEAEPETFHKDYKDNVPARYRERQDAFDAQQRKKAEQNWYSWWYQRGIIVKFDKADRYGSKRLSMTFERKKENSKEKLVNLPLNTVKTALRHEKVILSSEDYNEEDKIFLGDFREMFTNPLIESDKKFRIKHDKRKIQ